MAKKFEDKFNILNNKGEREITLKKICGIIGIDVPEKYRSIQDDIMPNVATKLENASKGGGFFRIIDINSTERTLMKWAPKAVRKGIKVVFAEKSQFVNEGMNEADYPIIPVDNVIDKCGKFFSYLKDLNNVKTIAVTGTCGKTTTMKFLGHIVPKAFDTYMNSGNANSYNAVSRHIMEELTPDKDVYIQEAGAAAINSVRKSAAMLTVDAFVLLNVFNHHINEYKTQDNILRDKASFDDYMKPGGVVIANYDDELISSHSFKHKVISFGINTEKEVDYRAENIRQNGEFLELDIVHNSNKIHLKISILGIQNAYNALAAFALCDWMGISQKKIIEGFNEYKSLGFRQNYRNVGGYNLLLDCYNVCEDSMKADLDTTRAVEIGKDNKRIAVLSGENKLGENAEEISFNTGRSLDLDEIDHVICVGVADETPENINYYCHGRALYEGIKSNGYNNISYVTNVADMENEIRKVISHGDLILFKGMYNLDLTPVADRIFGTSLAMNNPYYIKKSTKIEDPNYKALKFNVLNSLDIVEVKNKKRSKVKIPDHIDGMPIHRITPELFRRNLHVKEVDFGKSIANISSRSFSLCLRLKKVTIPSNVKLIDTGAFQYCISLKDVVIEEGVTHIGENAFRGCISLRKIVIPKTVKYIHENAFDNCPLLKVIRK